MSVLEQLAALVAETGSGRRIRVAVDGVDASGKTTLADRLAAAVRSQRSVVRASVDAFHRPRAERYRRGRDSPEGCYFETFDVAALRNRLLVPFAKGGGYVDAVFDHLRDAAVHRAPLQASTDAVLIVDGVFLQRPELPGWDLVVHLRIPDEEVLRRAVLRDGGPPKEVLARYRQRYLPAQRLYEAEVEPTERADVVLENSDPAAPVVLRWPGPGERR